MDAGTASTGGTPSMTDAGTAGTGGAQISGGTGGTGNASAGAAGTASEPPFDAGVDAGSTGGAFASNDDGGCGCRTARGSSFSGSFAALAALLLLVSRRRSVSWSFRTLRLPQRALCLRWAAATVASRAFARRTRRAMLRPPPV
jgi:MYXO-CTERM domain-containing protein